MGEPQIDERLMRKYIWDTRLTDEGCEWLTAAAQRAGSPLAIVKKVGRPFAPQEDQVRWYGAQRGHLIAVTRWFLTGHARAYGLRNAVQGGLDEVLVRSQMVEHRVAGDTGAILYDNLYAGQQGAERRVRELKPSGTVFFYKGKKGAARMVCEEHADGTVILFEGKRGVERMVFGRGPSEGVWRRACCLYQGARGAERKVAILLHDGTFDGVAVLHEGEKDAERKVSGHYPDGRITLFQGEKGAERKVRHESPDGAVRLFEGEKDAERMEIEVHSDGRVMLYEGERGAERKVLQECPDGIVVFYEGEKGSERKVREHHPDGSKFLYVNEGGGAATSNNNAGGLSLAQPEQSLGLAKIEQNSSEWPAETALRERKRVLRERENALREQASALRARQSKARVRESALRKRAKMGCA